MLQIQYLPLSELVLWDRNPKLHDIGALSKSFEQHGFRDPVALDKTLGAIVEGNGRAETLQMMKQQGQKPPDEIQVREDGEWLIPVIIGGDAKTKAQAEAYGIDHNNLTMAGGDFGPFEIAGMWTPEYAKVLAEIRAGGGEMASVSGDDIDALLQAGHTGENPSLDDLENQYGQPDDREFWPLIKLQVSPETHEKYEALMAMLPGADEAEKFDALVTKAELSE